MASVAARLARLEWRRGDCRGRPTVLLTCEAGRPVPEPPPGSPRCPHYGGRHPLYLVLDPNFYGRPAAGEVV